MTDTNVEISYDADWGNSSSHAPFIYDYFSQTLRERETLSQEFRIVSDIANFKDNQNKEWVIGISYFEVNEANVSKSLAKAAIGWKSRSEIYFIVDK